MPLPFPGALSTPSPSSMVQVLLPYTHVLIPVHSTWYYCSPLPLLHPFQFGGSVRLATDSHASDPGEVTHTGLA